MKTCGYCGRENEDEAAFCPGCGQNEYFPPAAAEAHLKDIETELKPEPPTPDVSPDEEAAICPFCLFPNSTSRRWCKQCDAPIMGVSFGPFESAWAVGSMWRGAVRGRPKPFVLFGIWAYFLPGLLLAPSTFIVGAYFSSLLVMGMSLVYAAMSFSMLYQTTRNYLRFPKPNVEE